jgi:GSH-dependent disulfide-bond oxidoreductase
VLNKRLADREFVAGPYSIADIAIVGWALGWKGQTMDIEEFPNVKNWLDRMTGRPAVVRGLAVGADYEEKLDLATDKAAQAILFNQRPAKKTAV